MNYFAKISSDNERLQIAKIFLSGRLENYETIFWAIGISDEIIRSAISDMVQQSVIDNISEPWLQAWRLILQSWSQRDFHLKDQSLQIYSIERRINKGDESLDLIDSIINLVIPKVKVSRTVKSYGNKLLKPPKIVDDIISVSLSNGCVIDPNVVDISDLKSKNLLTGIAERSGASLDGYLSMARFLNSDAWLRWKSRDIRRIIRPTRVNGRHSSSDIDLYSEGIAGLVRLHFDAIMGLSKIDVRLARSFAELCLNKCQAYIYKRIWAALAFDNKIVEGDVVFSFLTSVDDEAFWDVYAFPEISELRSKRFRDLRSSDKEKLISRISNGPPKKILRKSVSKEMEEYRIINIARELKRLVIGGATLDSECLKLIALGEAYYPELVAMNSVEYDFDDGGYVSWGGGSLNPDYDQYFGEARLQKLQKDLLAKRIGFEVDKSQEASSWIASPKNFSSMALDFSKTKILMPYGDVLRHFLTSHRPPNPGDLIRGEESQGECLSIFNKLIALPDPFIGLHIKDICNWCSQWRVSLIADSRFTEFWQKLLKYSIYDVDSQAVPGEELNLSTQIKSNSEDNDDLDVYGSSISDLVTIFFEMCSIAEKNDANAFKSDKVIEILRDELISVVGRPGLMIKHRFIEHASYFYRRDPDWTSKNLFNLLNVESEESAALWRAISRNHLTSEVIGLIGKTIVNKVCDQSLSKKSRSNLAWSLVVEVVNSYFDKRDSKISPIEVQQMLRMTDDEIRAHVIKIVEKFVIEVSGAKKDISKYELYKLIGRKFFKEVWPQETSLATQSISKSLASLPFVVSEHLDEIVADIGRFLKPFSAWSMQDYGVGYLELNKNTINFPKTEEDAIGFIELLSLTVDERDGAVVPYDLSLALEHITEIYPKIKKSNKYSRLLTISRRR